MSEYHETKVSTDGEVTKNVVKLKREINLLHATAIMTGVMIGSGIFVSPISIISQCGSVGLSLIIWGASGAVTLCVVLCYAELAGIYPKAGGEYAFFMEVLGPLVAFLNVWIQFLTIKPCFLAIVSLTTIDYVMYPAFADCDAIPAAKILLSVLVLFTMAAINSVYVRYVTRIQTVFMVLKICALVLINLGALLYAVRGRVDTSVYTFSGTTANPGLVGIALFSGIFTYGGWNYLFYLLEEVQNPEKIVVRAVYISMALVTLLYLLTNVAYFAVLSPDEMIASQAVAVSFASRVFGHWGTVVLPILVACSTLGALNGSLLGATRQYFAAARDGLFPCVLATLHTKYYTPWTSIISSSALSVVYILAGDAVDLIEYLGFVDTFIYVVAVLCVLWLRYKMPHMKRPVKVPLFMAVMALVILTGACILAVYEKPARNGIGFLFVLSGIPAYIVGVTWKNKPKSYFKYTKLLYVAIHKALLVAKEDKHREED